MKIKVVDRRWGVSKAELTPPSRVAALLRRIRHDAKSLAHTVHKDIDHMVCHLLGLSMVLPMATWDSGLRLVPTDALWLLRESRATLLIDKISSLAAVLPLLVGPAECYEVFEGFLEPHDWRRGLADLQLKLGPFFGPLMGNPTGRYSLDFKDRFSAAAALKLSCINNEEKRFARDTGMGDTSQHRNCENFRNCTFRGITMPELDEEFFYQPPRSGQLNFDYVSTTRPPWGTMPIEEQEFNGLVAKLGMVPTPEGAHRLWFGERPQEALSDEEKEQESTCGPGLLPRRPSAAQRRRHTEDEDSFDPAFLEMVAQHNRQKAVSERRRITLIKHNVIRSVQPVASPLDTTHRRALGAITEDTEDIDGDDGDLGDKTGALVPDLVALLTRKWISTHQLVHVLKCLPSRADTDRVAAKKAAKRRGEGRGSAAGVQAAVVAADILPPTPKKAKGKKGKGKGKKGKGKGESEGGDGAKEPVAIESFTPAPAPENVCPRIIVLQLLFGRIVDLYNFHIVHAALSEAEQAEAFYRLGWLNLFNPVRPVRQYDLDMSKPEEREMVRVLLNLAQEEVLKYAKDNGGKDCESWLNGRLNMSGLLSDTIVRDWDLRVLRLKWGRNEDNIPRTGYIRLGWDNNYRYEEARLQLQSRFLVGAKQVTAPYGDDPPRGVEYLPVPLQDDVFDGAGGSVPGSEVEL